MGIGEICNREVVFANRKTSLSEAARLMREHHVGDVIVVSEETGKRHPVGIVTDRDIVVEVIATGLDPNILTVEEIMVPDLAMVGENTGVFESIIYMRDKGVRRMPVVGEGGELIGVVTLDDLILLLAEEMGELARLIRHEQDKEMSQRH